MNLDSKIYIAGHRGMVGSAIFRALKSKGFQNIIFRTSGELDLRNQQAVADFFASEKPEYIFLAAASVGGILANSTYRADFIYDNLMIESNIIHSAWVNKVSKLMFLGSSCIYPKLLVPAIKELIQLGIRFDFKKYGEALNYSSKLDSVVNKILENKYNGNGKIVFCHFREEIDEIANRLRAGGIRKIAIFDGRISNGKRADILNDKNDVLILQIQTGCEGLNLQENYSEIYFVSPHWNPAIEEQAIARCHRIGQMKEVTVTRFEMSNFVKDEDQEMETRTVDNYVNSVQDTKRKIIDEFIN
jgi:SNF2 family DNA or RNA helicase